MGTRSVKYYIMFYTNVSSNQEQYPIFLEVVFRFFFPTHGNKSLVIDPKPQETIILLYSHHPQHLLWRLFHAKIRASHVIHYTPRSFNKLSIIYIILYYLTQMDGFCRWPWSRSRVQTIFKMPMSRVKCFGHVTRVCGIRQTRSQTAATTCTDSTAAVFYTIGITL